MSDQAAPKVISPDEEGWEGWEKIGKAETRRDGWQAAKHNMILYLIFGSIAIPLVIGGVSHSLLVAILLDPIILAVLAGVTYALEYQWSRCAACRRPWSAVWVAKKLASTKDWVDSQDEYKEEDQWDVSEEKWKKVSVRTGRKVYTDKRTDEFLYYMKCRHCGHNWNRTEQKTYNR